MDSGRAGFPPSGYGRPVLQFAAYEPAKAGLVCHGKQSRKSLRAIGSRSLHDIFLPEGVRELRCCSRDALLLANVLATTCLTQRACHNCRRQSFTRCGVFAKKRELASSRLSGRTISPPAELQEVPRTGPATSLP